MSLTFQSFSFGCRVNEAEKEKIDKELVLSGFSSNSIKPDIYLINTCAVTQKAERETRNLIYFLKKRNPETKIIITGCSATYWLKNNLYESLPINLIIPNENKEDTVKHILSLFSKIGKRNSVTKNIVIKSKFFESKRLLLKIQDGCNSFCSYCIVAHLRGNPQSVRIIDLINEINSYADSIEEVILTAINTQMYGKDTKESLVLLLENIFEKTNVRRISFGSIHPLSITRTFLEFYKQYAHSKRFVHFFHIPLQSGSDIVLTRMNRVYNTKEFADIVLKIKKINPHAFIATDIIVGFLGETNQEFKETYDFLKKNPISKFHVFRYSPRINTYAWKMKKIWKEQSSIVKKERSAVLRKLGEKKYEEFLKIQVGRKAPALLLHTKVRKWTRALFDNQIPVFVSSRITNNKPIQNVRIDEYKNGNLFGTIIR